MGRYEYNKTTTSFLFSIFLIFCFYPMVLSLLSQNQTNTMTTLSQLLLNASVPWNSHSNPCTWKGVTCDTSKSHVIEITLSRYSLSSSSFLPVLCQIETLEHLDVSNNLLSSIPDEFITHCGKLKGLKLLNFTANKLDGDLPAFHGFDALESLDLSFNLLGGIISLQFEELISLKSLNLRSNKFWGPIPTKLGKSIVLEQIVLSVNQFQGEIPEQIFSYENLNLIDLGENNLSGPIPSNISNLTKFENLLLSDNQLSGLIPEDLFSASRLQVLVLSNNMLNGSLPARISPSIFRLRLDGNFLSGSIPSDAFATARNLTYLELKNNALTGVIPATLGSCKNLALLNLAKNQLSGILPPELGNLTNLEVLSLQINKLDGTIPFQIGQLQKLLVLNLSWNSLDGSIPSQISNLSNLEFLNLQRNNMSGSIPESIGNLRGLMDLQLGENRLSGVIPNMPVSLTVALSLSINNFRGPIPSSLGNLDNLEVLDLSNNYFNGAIPDSLTKMLALTMLNIANNQLSGTIPKFPSYVFVEYQGPNNNLVEDTTQNNNTSLKSAKNGISVAVAVVIAIAAAIFFAGLVTVLVVSISPSSYRVNLLTPNGLHRSRIDFSKAMEAVADRSNVTLKTRFSTYYKAIMPSGSTYFVKKLNWTYKALTAGSDHRFEIELDVLAKLNNYNVMTPLAYVLSNDAAYVLYEYISNGSLFDVLHGGIENNNSLDWASRYSIAVGVAQGLSFLHEFGSSPILLLDLSSKSIMLKSLKEPLLGDIEHYKVIDPSKSIGNFYAVAGSVGYIPPEYAYTMTLTTAGNVYSFGVILLELLTGKPAVTEGTELVKWISWNSENEDYIIDLNLSGTSQAVRNQMLTVMQIALVCVSSSPEARPHMNSVLMMLLNA